MAIDINTALYNLKGIDSQSVAKVAGEILNSANAKSNQPQVQGLDYSKFNRVSLGVDLYSNRTGVELQKQVAMIQAGLYTQSVNIAKLNSNAAANLYSAVAVEKQVELTQSISQVELISPSKLEELDKSIKLFNISDKNSKAKNGSNPFGAEEESNEEQAK